MFETRHTTAALCFLAMVSCTSSPAPTVPATPPESTAKPVPKRDLPQVIVLGMIHGEHRTSERYGLQQLREIIARVDPDVVLTEIPPDRFATAKAQFAADGSIEEPRVSRFPEYVDVIFPMTREYDFEIVPCAGWTETMAKDRREKLDQWKQSRAEESAEVDAAMEQAEARIAAEGKADDPRFIHSERYDEIVKEGMEPYNRLFNDDLGAGGWGTINSSHYALIAKAIDERYAPGKTFLITFGAWHKYWFLEQLTARDDIVVRPAADFLVP